MYSLFPHQDSRYIFFSNSSLSYSSNESVTGIQNVGSAGFTGDGRCEQTGRFSGGIGETLGSNLNYYIYVYSD
jgi:hypothetical protein